MDELSTEEKIELIASIADPKQEHSLIHRDELSILLRSSKPEIRAYDGFEPSGRMHIAQGLMKTLNVNKLTRAGVKVVFLVADWFALLNEKMGGDAEKIRVCGEYLIEVWKACGMDMEKVEFLWSSEEINKRPDEYWSGVMDIARHFNVSRIKRCGQVMGRATAKDSKARARRQLIEQIAMNREQDAKLSEEEFMKKYEAIASDEDDGADAFSCSQLLYPMMQCMDIFFLKADICQLGMDQLKVNTLAREFCKAKQRSDVPVVVSNHMLMGLEKGQVKMSKSDPNSAIFMEDEESTVRSKIKNAFCAPGDVETNPILDYCEHVIFPSLQGPRLSREFERRIEFVVPRPDKFGGDLSFRPLNN